MKKEKSDQNAVAELTREGLYKENRWLWEENETLKDNVEFLHSCLDDRDKSIAIMQEENKKLEKENFVMKDRLKFGYKGVTKEEIERVEEENKKLKSDLAFERTMLDNVKAEYKSLQNVIKKLKEENEKLREELSAYDREYFDEDKKAKNIFIEEDTLQELRDIGEL